MWVMRDPGSKTRDHLQAGLAQLDVNVHSLRVVLELPANDAALEAVEGSRFITAVSELAAARGCNSGPCGSWIARCRLETS
jgi:hypothetical protein